MAISAPGVGSGLDVKGIITQLMAIERQPLVRLEQQRSSFNARLSAFGQLNSALDKLRESALALTRPASFSATTASVAEPGGFSARSTTQAVPGNYSIEVTALARAQRIASDAGGAPPVAPGNLTLSFGRVDGGGFIPDAEGPVTISLTAGDTLAELRDTINAAQAGISARIINNGSTDQLVLSSDDTGAARAFRIEGSGGLAGFGFDPAAPAGGSLTAVQAASDASLSIDGIAVTRASNTVTDLVEGVTLELARTTDGEVILSIGRDNEAAKSAIEAFVKAYNDLAGLVRTQTAFNAESGQAGILNGDSTVRSIQSQLRNIFREPVSGLDGARLLSDIGVSFRTDGTLEIDEAALEAALADPQRKVGQLFGGNGTVEGYAQSLAARIDGMLVADGLLKSRTEGINRSLRGLETRREAIEFRLTRIEARFTAQFSALDAMIASMTQTSNFLTQQLATLPGAGGQNRD